MFISFYYKDKLNLEFRFVPLTYKGKGDYNWEQARALEERDE